jgi:hypothetical protein
MSCAVCGRKDHEEGDECPYYDETLELLESGKKFFEENGEVGKQ